MRAVARNGKALTPKDALQNNLIAIFCGVRIPATSSFGCTAFYEIYLLIGLYFHGQADTQQKMVEQLSSEELAEFREIFNLVDRDGGGTITQEELGELMVCALL